MNGVVALIVAFVAAIAAVGGSAVAGPPAGLSQSGRALWNFEALLHDTFGSKPVCDRGDWNFIAPPTRCAPLSTWLSYEYVFTDAHDSGFGLTSRRPTTSVCNVCAPIRIASKYVACPGPQRSILVRFVNRATFTVGCFPFP